MSSGIGAAQLVLETNAIGMISANNVTDNSFVVSEIDGDFRISIRTAATANLSTMGHNEFSNGLNSYMNIRMEDGSTFWEQASLTRFA